MSEGNQNVRVPRGNPVTLDFAIRDRSGESLDIASATWTMSDRSPSSAVLLTKVSGTGATLSGSGTAWNLSVSLTSSDTNRPAGIYPQKVTITDATGGPYEVSRGFVQIT